MRSREKRLSRALPWLAAALFGFWCYVIMVVAARVDLLGRFDDGIEYTTVTYLLHGQIPFTDFYEPYGVGLGVPGVLPHVLGFDGAFALRLTYGLFPALVTLLVTPFVWRRCGPVAAVVVGLLTMTSQTPRYSMGFAALFGFLLIVDRAVRSSLTRTLRDAASSRPGTIILASFVLSLAGWARTEYAVFAVVWAAILAIELRGRRRASIPALSVLFAALPTLTVLVTGGLTRLWWFVEYTLSSSPSGFHAQRGQPIEWHILGDRLSEIAHLQLGTSTPAEIVGSYGLALTVSIVGIALLVVPHWRRAVLARDASRLTPFMVLVCAIVLYGQVARFSTTYGAIGNPVFWVAAALLIGRRGRRATLAIWSLLVVLVAYPFVPGIAPGAIHDAWASRPAVDNRAVVPGFNRIPFAADEGATSMAALAAEWRSLGLTGRATVSVELRNDVAWGNEAIVGFLLDAPAAAWPLTYDPGLVNTAKVERSTIHELCANRAPVVQGNGDYPYPAGVRVDVGSRLLDEFLAANYRIVAFAGYYRVLVPFTPRCELPQSLTDSELEARGGRWLREGEPAPAGALAIARLERGPTSASERASDAALAALGGYALKHGQAPSGPLGAALEALSQPSSTASGLAAAASHQWPTDIERLAVQTAWIAHRMPSEAGTAQAAVAVLALALRHADWPQAITNVSAVQPPTRALFATLSRRGARGMPAFDRWRRGYFVEGGDVSLSIVAGIELIEDYVRRSDPIEAAKSESELATYPGVAPDCALALQRRAALRPGSYSMVPGGGAPCTQQPLAGFLG